MIKKILFPFLLLLFMGACDTKEGNSGPKYVLTFFNVSNGTDNDGDGYYSTLRLNFDIDVDVEEEKTVFVQIYYRLTGTETYSLLFTSVDFFIFGSSTSDEEYINLTNMSHGTYDFKIEVLESNTTGVKTSGEVTSIDLETSTEDLLPINIWSITWSNPVDADADGYYSSRRLNMDVDIPGGTASIYAKIYYKLAANSSYILYRTTSSWTITGSASGDAHFETIGTSPTLPHGTYDFKVEIYRTSTSTPIVASDDPSSDADLDNQNFELSGEDAVNIISIWSSTNSDFLDNDGDFNYAGHRLRVDVDVTNSATENLVLTVSRKLSTSSTYTVEYTTPTFSISGSASSDAVTIWMRGFIGAGLYDYKVDVYRASALSTVVATSGPGNDADLDNIPREWPVDDGWYISMESVTVLNTVDSDGDGYFSNWSISTNYTVGILTKTRIMKYSWRNAGSSNAWAEYLTNAPLVITPGSTTNITAQLQFLHFIYDIRVQIFEDGNSVLQDEIIIYNVKLEPTSDD